ncbi:hypothetical protein TNCV_1833381 [Trichonephila clavipes]|nr:hypothetical protein TNCV_1833381 [Trichonephila clavipes]
MDFGVDFPAPRGLETTTHFMHSNTTTYAIFRSRQFVFCLRKKLVKIGEIGNGNEEVVNLARQINLEVDSGDILELLDSHNQELTMDELIEMYEQEQSIEKLESF